MNYPLHLITSFFVLTLAGIINASYLTYKHYQKKPLLCPLDHKCDVVTESKWSHIFGIRNEIVGILFFAGMFFSLFTMLILPLYASTLFSLILLSSTLGVLFSLALLSIQAFIIKDYCFYCLLSAGLTLLLFLNTLALH